MPLAALLIGILIIIQGVAGLAVPAMFVSVVREFQTPPVIYVAAVIRIAFGAVLFLAAPASRTPRSLRGVGALIALGGLLTPVIGIEFAQVVLRWWAEGGSDLVRAWAGVALAIGVFIVYATSPNHRAA